MGYILKVRGRWNREGVYGCLYTALTEDGALAEAVKYLKRAGIAPRFSPPRDLVSLRVRLDGVMDLTSPSVRRSLRVSLATITRRRRCRSRDVPVDRGPGAAAGALRHPLSVRRAGGATNLNIYVDGRADHCDLSDGGDRIPVTPDLFERFY